MLTRTLLTSIAVAAALVSLPQRAQSNTLELALVIDGSGSISPSDWDLQIGAYQSVFQNDFFTNFIQPSPFDDIVVGAFVFSGGSITIRDQDGNITDTEDFAVTSVLDWTLIQNDATAFAFGGGFSSLVQPSGTTATSEALTVAAFGGDVGCVIPDICNVSPKSIKPGLLTNAFAGDVLVIDISTDGVPTEPNGNGTPNQDDNDLAIAAANAARSAGIKVNAIGVGDGVDDAFLRSLVGIDPAATPTGFFLTASGFDQFNDALLEKIGRETQVPEIPLPPTLPLALTSFLWAFRWRRKPAAA